MSDEARRSPIDVRAWIEKCAPVVLDGGLATELEARGFDIDDPLWSAISETGLPVCFHIGLNTQLEDLAQRDPTPQKGIFVPLVPLTSAEALRCFQPKRPAIPSSSCSAIALHTGSSLPSLVASASS